jgi:uncharacterized membrane protein YfcA
MTPLQAGLAVLSGGVVGFTLGLIGGGGSILATPMLLYIVGLPPHVAIGTSALAVSANAFANFAGHARAGNVRWHSAILFALVGAVGAAGGSILGKALNGQRLLFLFALLMIVVGTMMLLQVRRAASRSAPKQGGVIAPASVPRVVATALAVGLLAGFFGIGGGFLIVPGLLFATGMPMICAIGCSLLAVGTFGLTTATSYALSGLIDWLVAALYIAGGLVGGLLGMRLAWRLAVQKAVLNKLFAIVIFAVAAYMIYRTAAAAGLG